MKAFARNTLFALLPITLIILDQFLKYLFAAKKLVIDLGIVSLHFVANTGASFGMLQGSNALLAWFSIMVLGVIMINTGKVKREQLISVLLLVAGIIGNLIDRVFRGFVVDFVDFKFWPVFNIADSCVVIGVVWLSIVILVKDIKEKKKTKIKTQKKK